MSEHDDRVLDVIRDIEQARAHENAEQSNQRLDLSLLQLLTECVDEGTILERLMLDANHD